MSEQPERPSDKIRAEYMKDVELLSRYMNWMEKSIGKSVHSTYEGDGTQKIMSFPVYDSNLLGFVKAAETTKLIDRNYQLTYTRYHIKDMEDEKRLLRHSHLKDIDVFKAILSRYVLGGKSKGYLWADAMEQGIFLELMRRLTALFFSTNLD